ncbi:MAG TPA: hypothetical protein VNF06_00185 [Candidatus Aquilonibacter sp.]|nr:hypothetical protein [Candidatus Aquilonibacter sp.]
MGKIGKRVVYYSLSFLLSIFLVFLMFELYSYIYLPAPAIVTQIAYLFFANGIYTNISFFNQLHLIIYGLPGAGGNNYYIAAFALSATISLISIYLGEMITAKLYKSNKNLKPDKSQSYKIIKFILAFILTYLSLELSYWITSYLVFGWNPVIYDPSENIAYSIVLIFIAYISLLISQKLVNGHDGI